MIKTIIIVLLLFCNSIYSIEQCPVMVNKCISEYCFCPNKYDRHIITYNGKKCYRCLPKCGIFDCSLNYCYCDNGYKKTYLNGCYKCILSL